jgi:hypothetical protein
MTSWMLVFSQCLQYLVNKLRFLFTISTWLSNVHTWALFFLRHLANMSCMVPFWASTDSGSVPIWGPRLKPRHQEEVVYILNDSCSHFTQRLFPPKVPQPTQDYYLLCEQYIEYHSYLLYITFIRTFTSLFTCLVHVFISSDLPGRLAAHGFLCPLQEQFWSWTCVQVFRSCIPSSVRVNKHHTADSTDKGAKDLLYYHHRHSGIDVTNIST